MVKTWKQTDDNESFASSRQSNVDLMLVGDEAEMLTLPAQTRRHINSRWLHRPNCRQNDVIPLAAYIVSTPASVVIYSFWKWQLTKRHFSSCISVKFRTGQTLSLDDKHNKCKLQENKRKTETYITQSKDNVILSLQFCSHLQARSEDWDWCYLNNTNGPNVRLWNSAKAKGLDGLTERVPNVRQNFGRTL